MVSENNKKSGCKKKTKPQKNKSCDACDKSKYEDLGSDDEPMTLQEIGDIFGVSRMRICQIEKSILAKLRKPNSPFNEFKKD